MKLGNSKGNNTGKKYFVRSHSEKQQKISDANRAKADDFNQWFAANYDHLRNFLIGQNSFDEDAFSYTFMRISEKLLFTGADVNDYKAYFCRSYYTNYIQGRIAADRYVAMPRHDSFEAHHTNPYERERQQVQLELDVFDYVYQHYALKEFELFKLYVSLKPAINYHTLADLTHIKVHTIQRIISGILTDIRSNKKLMERYREVK
ncbi:hypothetical protein [Dysgonomonas sp. 511]|uniref:hypothetical protein n=1 Tax=Dysgonomonas sp. 511 TaxID=2302930 RepID=UPI0013D8581B|nr:hypothetical protein [Dysgonomonas sp. 511]NDV79319.1 hypothetical protein [Dysgonomonas sp. 511]